MLDRWAVSDGGRAKSSSSQRLVGFGTAVAEFHTPAGAPSTLTATGTSGAPWSVSRRSTTPRLRRSTRSVSETGAANPTPSAAKPSGDAPAGGGGGEKPPPTTRRTPR